MQPQRVSEMTPKQLRQAITSGVFWALFGVTFVWGALWVVTAILRYGT
jgi:uncharacterized membrane protein